MLHAHRGGETLVRLGGGAVRPELDALIKAIGGLEQTVVMPVNHVVVFLECLCHHIKVLCANLQTGGAVGPGHKARIGLDLCTLH